MLLKRYYPTIIIWYAKLELMRLHRMRLRQFTARQPIPDIPITPREWQPDHEVVITHDDLYARAWKCEYDEPILQ